MTPLKANVILDAASRFSLLVSHPGHSAAANRPAFHTRRSKAFRGAGGESVGL